MDVPARDLKRGDLIRVDGVDELLTVTYVFLPSSRGLQSVITSDGITREFPADWSIDAVVGDDERCRHCGWLR